MIGIVVGTRPEIVKLAPVVWALKERGEKFLVVNTSQHFDPEMSDVFFRGVMKHEPEVRFSVGEGGFGERFGEIQRNISKLIVDRGFRMIVVQGDTLTVMAATLAARSVGVLVAHVEAGLRSFDVTMPEEISRIVADHNSEILFCPTEVQRKNLEMEGVVRGVHVVGNTIVDSVRRALEEVREEEILGRFGLEPKKYILLTSHRMSNVDDKRRIGRFFRLLRLLYENYAFPVVFPMHPRTKKRIVERFHLWIPAFIRAVEPLDFHTFVVLEKNAKLIFTDSGGVQEEACILGVPCLTLRANTERPETIRVGANRLVDVDYVEGEELMEVVDEMFDRKGWENPFGEGNTGRKIVGVLSTELERVG